MGRDCVGLVYVCVCVCVYVRVCEYVCTCVSVFMYSFVLRRYLAKLLPTEDEEWAGTLLGEPVCVCVCKYVCMYMCLFMRILRVNPTDTVG